MTDTPTPRHDGWTPEKQCIFLESLANDGHVRRAAQRAGMSHEAAYQLRRRNEGTAFRLGWDAGLLLARTGLEDTLMARALDGQDDMIVREDDGRTRTRTRHDNRLALSLLARLDRFADDHHHARTDARTVMNDWQAFLELVAEGGDAEATDDFLCDRRPNRKRAFGPCQLHDAEDDEMTKQEKLYQRLADRYSVWFDDTDEEYRTNFPPPPGFDGYEEGDVDQAHYGERHYQRCLSPLEEGRERAVRDAETAEELEKVHAWRREYFEIEAEDEEPALKQTLCSDWAEPVS